MAAFFQGIGQKTGIIPTPPTTDQMKQEPLSVCLMVAAMRFMGENARLGITAEITTPQCPGTGQTVERFFSGHSHTDINLLKPLIERAISIHTANNNTTITTIYKHAVEGLKVIKTTYQKRGYRDTDGSIDHLIKILNEALLFKSNKSAETDEKDKKKKPSSKASGNNHDDEENAGTQHSATEKEVSDLINVKVKGLWPSDDLKKMADRLENALTQQISTEPGSNSLMERHVAVVVTTATAKNAEYHLFRATKLEGDIA